MTAPSPIDRRPSLTLAAIGPRGHGKSLLAAALSYALRDHLDGRFTRYAELTRGGAYHRDGIQVGTLAPRWLELVTERRRYVLLDLPGAPRHTTSQLCPLAAADAALLIVAAPRWSASAAAALRERLLVARHLGAKRAVACLEACHEVEDPALLDLAELELRELLVDAEYAQDTPVVRVAAAPALAGDPRWTEALRELAAALDAWLVVPARDDAGPLRMSLLRGFLISGRGAVAAGKLERGSLRAGDEVELIGTPRDRSYHVPRVPVRAWTRAASLRSFERTREAGRAGEMLGALLQIRWGPFGYAEAHLATRGMLVVAPDTLALHREARASIRLLAESVATGPCQLLLRTGNHGATLRLARAAGPGELVDGALELVAPLPIAGGERFAVRREGRLLGLGVLAAPDGPGLSIAPVRWW